MAGGPVNTVKPDLASCPVAAVRHCQICGSTTEQKFTCVQCNNLAFCNDCWPKWVLHGKGAVGWGNKPHEKSDPLVVARLRRILEPTRSESDHQNELIDDEDTSWFGFGRDSSGQPIFQDYGQFAAIIRESYNAETVDRYPQLVSFIGETGAGKSTLIKLLIDLHDNSYPGVSAYRSPVTSSNFDHVPTTGDVHLYADPASFFGTTPLLFADCEGLNGGEAIPKGLRHRSENLTIKDSRRINSPAPSSNSTQAKRSPRRKHTSQRYVSWANSPRTRKREHFVSQLYPRILYMFSDVVVFVLRNPRAFESTVLDKLIRWGAASVDKSLNQPVLPHAVLVFNASEDIEEEEFDVDTVTSKLMTEIRDAIAREPALVDYVNSWRQHGKNISTTAELLECYYASVTVIYIPSRGQYMLMDQQIRRLYDLVKSRCATSQLRKRRVRMLANADRLQVYLQAAFDHFTSNLETPFDFVKEALRHSPIPRDFQGNILNLAVSVKNHSTDDSLRNDFDKIFLSLAKMIASCVMFDAVQQNLMGTSEQLLDDAYAQPCLEALKIFTDMHWPCSYRNGAYPKEQGRCCNVKVGHNPKGHQNIHGKIIAQGGYQIDIDTGIFGETWINLIRTNLLKLQNCVFKLGQELPDRKELQIAAIIHRERINEFYRSVGNVASFVSQTACFSCLRELPVVRGGNHVLISENCSEAPLPCGHVLCLPCIHAYGRKTSRTTIEISRCPLHVREVMADPPWVIPIKPPHAGCRILSLDGGGIKGIVELQVLKAIEKVLGPKMPLRLFFDLIVGNGCGGIIALGLGVENWSVDQCIREFKELLREAFIPRELTGVPLLETLTSMYHGSAYKTQPFEKALKKAFTERPLFGGTISRHNKTVKVVVTSATAIEQQPVAFANYNRPDSADKNPRYNFMRLNGSNNEMKTWEAATSATPGFFKPFQKHDNKALYIDSGEKYNCPIWVADNEARLIWSDVADSPPDILLSIGVGVNVLDSEHSQSQTVTLDQNSMASLSSPSIRSTKITKVPRKQLTGSTATSVYDDYLRNNKIWDEFVRGKFQFFSPSSESPDDRRYIRINPALNIKIPSFDGLQNLRELEQESEEVLQQNMPVVGEVAHRLIASSFFFEKDASSLKQTANGYSCSGSIFCRFRVSSDEMKALGEFLKSCLRVNFEPYFIVADDAPQTTAGKIPITETMIHDVYLRGYFNIDPLVIECVKMVSKTEISLCLQKEPYPSGVTALPISGFPRQLINEDGGRTVPSHHSSVLRNNPGTVDAPRNPSPVRSSRERFHVEKLEPISPLSVRSDAVAELESPTTRAELPADVEMRNEQPERLPELDTINSSSSTLGHPIADKEQCFVSKREKGSRVSFVV